MNSPSYTPVEMHLFVLFSSLKGTSSADWALMRFRSHIAELRPEAQAIILLLAGKDLKKARKQLPALTEHAWKDALAAYEYFEPLAEARRREAEDRARNASMSEWACLA